VARCAVRRILVPARIYRIDGLADALRRRLVEGTPHACRRRPPHDGRRRGGLQGQRRGRHRGHALNPPIHLRGMTWNHPRGLDPLVAHATFYRQTRNIQIDWDARSLEDFEAFPLDELAAKYDLMVIDHPHVGMAAASGCLLPLE